MPSLDRLLATAHPNSALRRRFPNGCTAADLPNWRADRTDKDARFTVYVDVPDRRTVRIAA